jgi:hypothetical protein
MTHTAQIQPTFEAWRSKARELLRHGVAPENVDWVDASQTASLLAEEPIDYQTAPNASVKVPADFLRLAANVCAHTDERRLRHRRRARFRRLVRPCRHSRGRIDADASLGHEHFHRGRFQPHIKRRADRPHGHSVGQHDEGPQGILRDREMRFAAHQPHPAFLGRELHLDLRSAVQIDA